MAGVMLDQIRFLTGHESTDAVRMALRRAGVKATGVRVGTGAWPPKKVYDEDEVWKVFGARMLERSAESDEVKKSCWDLFRVQITEAVIGGQASKLFSGGVSDTRHEEKET